MNYGTMNTEQTSEYILCISKCIIVKLFYLRYRNYDLVFILYESFTIFSSISSHQDSTENPST